MLFDAEQLHAIRLGAVDLAFRRWTRAGVRSGGTHLTAIGQLQIGALSTVAESEITEDDARRAGHPSRDALLAALGARAGAIYRIEIAGLRPDPRIALRDSTPDAAEAGAVVDRLRRLDGRAGAAWTRRVLEVIERHPGRRAGDLAGMVDMDRDPFKSNVRKLKALGLTESLEVGYRLSPRGEAILAMQRARA